MTKHNGKARKAGTKVGAQLMSANKKSVGGLAAGVIAGRHTLEVKGGTNMQSVLERNDLAELMAMADLADRDFTAEKAQVVVISTGTVDPLEQQRAAEERAQAEERHRHRLKLPRRPHWDATTTPEQLDTQERGAFVAWRRELAELEETEKLCLTPFEKNLEVWRQLWRVLERSDIVVQVVDARDPLLYRCDDLEAYARELCRTKHSLLLLNKADLLPAAVRQRWADHFDKAGVRYAFWSAFQTIQEHQALKMEASELGLDWQELREERSREKRLARLAAQAQLLATQGPEAVQAVERVRLLEVDELIAMLESEARQAVAAAGPDDPRAQDKDRRLMVGLVGYPNVGKSSTINALFGAKKTAVAPTPGKTKHFQTLIVSTTLCLCDCPGLVMPKFARSKAEMVAAGVIPIDKLTEMRGPIDVVAERAGRLQVEAAYGFKLAPPAAPLPPSTPPSAAQLLRALAMLRGWTVGSGLPDESRSGRQILKDFTAGKLLYCALPPGSAPASYTPLLHDPVSLQPLSAAQQRQQLQALLQQKAGGHQQQYHASQQPGAVGQLLSEVSEGEDTDSGGGEPEARDAGDNDTAEQQQQQQVVDGQQQHLVEADLSVQEPVPLGALDEADLDLLTGGLGGDGDAGAQGKLRRAEHKYQKKPARSKGDRGQAREEGRYDGAAMTTGKKGGLVRVGGHY